MDRKVIASGTIDTRLVAYKTVREVERIDFAIQKAGGCAKAGIDQKEGIAAMYVWKQIRAYRYTDKGTQMTTEKLLEIAQDTRVHFIQQHIINYTAFNVLVEFYDWLRAKKILTKCAEGFWRKVQRTFEDYQRGQKSFTEHQTWMLFLDHMWLSYETIRPQVKLLETTIRDYLIQHRKDIIEAGQRDDIEILQKAATCFILLTAMQKSYHDYFRDIIQTHGVDFSCEFRYADLSKMIRNAIWMCEQLGVRFGTDKDGDTILLGVNINDSVRVTSTWSKIVDTLGDADLLDKTAEDAINLNPETKKEYEEKLAEAKAFAAEEDERRLVESLDMLGEKFNLKKVSA